MIPEALDRVERGAELSPCRLYRFRLWRHWGEPGDARLGFLMLNPSTADESYDDPTIRRCMGFARRQRLPGIDVVNLFAYRTVEPSHLLDVHKRGIDVAGGPLADEAIWLVAARAEALVLAWGGSGRHLPPRAEYLIEQLRARKLCRLVCLGRTKSGAPRHPLYVRGDQPFEDF
jgi:hypothetical protein